MNYDYLSVLLSLGDGRTETERFGARYSNSHASGQIKILKKEPEKRVFMRLEAWNNYVRRIHADFYSERMCAHFGNEYLFQLKEFQVMEFLEVEIIGACKTRTRTIHTSGEKNKFMIYRSPDCDPILIKKT